MTRRDRPGRRRSGSAPPVGRLPRVRPLAMAVLALVPAAAAAGQPRPHPGVPQLQGPLVPGDTVLATPFGRYDAGPLHRFVLGDGHRDLWGVAVRAPVLDLGTYAGGLTPTELGGGQQTRSLRFRTGDGLEYAFRSIDKDAARTLDPELRRTLAADVVQDQIASLFPLSAMVVTAILDAAGILNPGPRLVVMPDDPRLREFREEFAGMLGWIEVRPDEGENDTPGFAGSARVIGTDRLFERLEEDRENRIDAPGYLRARLIDFLVGDWDRHPDQWRWAGFEDDRGNLVFEPVPRDRDWALARLDGMIARFTWVPWPHYVGFSHDYPSAFRASWSGRALDRRLLSEMERPEWEAVARDLQDRLTDAELEDAVNRLPEPYLERVGPELQAALLHRRDGLVSMALEFYDLLADEVDVHTTDDGELILAERLEGDRLRLRVFDLRDGEPRPEPFFDRTFLPDETREVRVYAHGDDDRIVVEGGADGDGGPVLRLVGGGGDDTFEDRSDGRGVHVYDHRGTNTFSVAKQTVVDEAAWDDPVDPEDNTHGAGYRSWGSRWVPLPRLSYDPDLGAFVGLGAQRTSYGFRHYPWKSRFAVTAGYSIGAGQPRVTADLDLPLFSPDVRGRLEVLASGAELTRFYGFGNATATATDDPADFEALRKELRIRSLLAWAPARGVELRAGPALTVLRPEENPGTVVEELSPYGYRDFEQLAVVGELVVDRRDHTLTPRHGVFLELEGRWSPESLDVAYAWGGVRGRATTYLSRDDGSLRPSLALRAGAEKLWGTYPYFEAAYLGGPETVRGFRNGRFAGDASLWGNAELRIFLTDFVFLLPGDLGAFALADVGRVFLEGETSDVWHSAAGGGVWASWVDAYTWSLAVARSAEETSLYFALGFSF